MEIQANHQCPFSEEEVNEIQQIYTETFSPPGQLITSTPIASSSNGTVWRAKPIAKEQKLATQEDPEVSAVDISDETRTIQHTDINNNIHNNNGCDEDWEPGSPLTEQELAQREWLLAFVKSQRVSE